MQINRARPFQSLLANSNRKSSRARVSVKRMRTTDLHFVVNRLASHGSLDRNESDNNNMTPKKSDAEKSISPRRSPRLVKANSVPRRSPRIQNSKVKRRSTPFPKEKIIFSPPPKPKHTKVHFSVSVDTQRRVQLKRRISRFLLAAEKAKVGIALCLGLGFAHLVYKHLTLENKLV